MRRVGYLAHDSIRFYWFDVNQAFVFFFVHNFSDATAFFFGRKVSFRTGTSY
jgi:hypothetical protein